MATLHYGDQFFELADNISPRQVLGWFAEGVGSYMAISVETTSGVVHLLRTAGVPIWVDERE
ncbi:MAG: hypothetical protein FWG15_02915 [Propionibacteriaceae bacterium]|nr:hypothetical protein [Propionibacteriaceae bacterium]